MDPIAVTNLNSPATTEAQQKLRDACDGIEGMFLKILLKEGMQGMLENDEGHSSSALAYALEQTADEIAHASETGIADSIYAQLSANM